MLVAQANLICHDYPLMIDLLMLNNLAKTRQDRPGLMVEVVAVVSVLLRMNWKEINPTEIKAQRRRKRNHP